MCLLGIRLVIKVQLLLHLERLLELVLQLFQIGLRLVALGLQELEATLPESALLIKKVSLLLKLNGRVIKLAPQLFVAISIVDLVVFKPLRQMVVIVSKVVDLSLVISDKLLALLLQVLELLVKHCLISFAIRRQTDQTLFNFL